MDGQYVDPHDGKIRNRYIEQTFLDFMEGDPDHVTLHNLHAMARTYFPDAPEPPAIVCTDQTAARKWARHFGPVTVWPLTDDDKAAVPNVLAGTELAYGAKIGPHSVGKAVAAATAARAICLAVAQLLREFAEHCDNQRAGDTTH